MILEAILGLTLFLGIAAYMRNARTYRVLEGRIQEQTQTLQSELLKLATQVGEQLTTNTLVVKDYTRVMGDFQSRLGQLQESTHSMIRVGEDISSLQEILRAPKPRGLWGELFLEELLRQILPRDRFVLQHTFRSGERVDAVILLGEGMVPVDSKFPLESLRRKLGSETEEESKRCQKQFMQDFKKHVDAISVKYILPQEGTFDFALMYLPAENVYYESIIREEGEGTESASQYALRKKVIPVSPNSFYAYLQAIVLGLRGLRIENSAREILNGLSQLASDFTKFNDDFEKLGSHLGNVRSAYDRAEKRLDRFKQQLASIESQESVDQSSPVSA